MSAVRSMSSLVLVIGLGAVLMAQTPALDIRFGLWEQTVITKMEGIPGIDTSKMKPEQIAQMQALMKSGMPPQTITQKTCLKKEDFTSDKFMMEEQPGVKCTRVVSTNTRTSYVANVTCTGDRSMTALITIDAASNSTYKGSMKVSSAAGGKTTNMTMSMDGKWLGAACGEVK